MKQHGYEESVLTTMESQRLLDCNNTINPTNFTVGTRNLQSGRLSTVDDDGEEEDSLSHSEYSDSDDDSAALFAEDGEESVRPENAEAEDEGDGWLDEDIHQSSKLIYNIMTLICVSSFVIAFVTLYYSRRNSNEAYRLVVSFC